MVHYVNRPNVTPAMEAGVVDHLWSMAEIVGLLDRPMSA
jgi:hypothetical protein